MSVLAIDPGNAHSGYVVYDAASRALLDSGKLDNGVLLARIYDRAIAGPPDVLAIEMAESFGAKVWDQVFKAVLWTGRFIEAWSRAYGRGHELVYRREVKLHLAGVARAKDPQIRQCLIDRWGGKDLAIGSKASPGPLRGVTADAWAALAIAVTFSEGATRARSAA